jgi:hypothetical protein
MKPLINQLYVFDFTGTISFGDLPTSFLYEMFRDGRFCCQPLSRYLDQVFDELTFVDKKGYDFTWNKRKVEKKQITNNGLKFCPSSMVGVGRKVNYKEVVSHIIDNDLLYIIADITEFPKVRVVFVEGTYLLDNCTSKNCSFSKPKALELFNAIKSE